MVIAIMLQDYMIINKYHLRQLLHHAICGDYYIRYRVTRLYRLGKTCYLHSLLCNNNIIAQFAVQ